MRAKAWCGVDHVLGIKILTLLLLVMKKPEQVCWAQQETISSLSSCLKQLVPCLDYLNGDGTLNPPDSCCGPLKSVIKSNPECLCSMISIRVTDAAEMAGINVTQAQELPGQCGQNVNPIYCLTGLPNSKNTIPNSASLLCMTVAATTLSAVWVLYSGFI